jgi:hypothetical protein
MKYTPSKLSVLLAHVIVVTILKNNVFLNFFPTYIPTWFFSSKIRKPINKKKSRLTNTSNVRFRKVTYP